MPARKSFSETTPTTRPSASVTGAPEKPRSARSVAAWMRSMSLATQCAGRVMMSAARIESRTRLSACT